MSDVNANIGIHFDTNDALAQLRRLQAGLSKFNQSLTQGNIAAENAQKGLNAQLMQSINATGKFVASQKTVSSSTTAFTDALEKNKLSMGQYFKFTAAAATANTKVFKNAFASEREIINRARKDRVKALQTQYIQLTNANGELVKVLQVVPKHLKMVNGEYTDYATRTQMAAQRQQLLNQLLKQGSTQLLNFGKNTQWAGRQLMVGFTVPLTMLGSVAAKAFQDMEEAVLKFERVYGDMTTTVSDTDKAVAGIQQLAKEFTKYGVAASETVKMAADAAAMGLTGADLTAQVTAATKLAVLGQVEQQEALETTISLQNAFGISAEELAKKINFLNAVENQTVLSIADLTTAIPKAGPVVKQLGGSVEDLAFFMTAMKEGGINASEGANALKSGLASIINPSKKATEMLAGFGINIKGLVNANAGDLKGTVLGFARALDTLAPLDRARAIETMFGKFQFARLSTLFQNITKDSSQAARALGLAGASVEELAILSERELGKVEDSVGVKFKKQMENLKLQLVPIGKAFLEAVTPIVKFASGILEKFNNLSDGTKKFVVGLVGFLGLIAPAALMTFGLVANGVANLIKFFAMLRGGMAKLNGQNNVLGGGFDYLTQQEIENLAQTQALHTSHQDLISTFNVEAASVNALAAAYGNAASQARALASGSPGLFNAAPGPTGAVSGLPKKFANGGLVPGTGNGDTVPALLTPGEFVVTKDDVKKHPELIAMFSSDRVQKFADGGIVGDADIENSTSQAARIKAMYVDGGDGSEAFKSRIKGLIKGATSKTEKGVKRVIDFAAAAGVEISAEQTEAIEEWRKKMLDAAEGAAKDLVDAVELTRDQIKDRLKAMSPIPGTQAAPGTNTFDLVSDHGNQNKAETFGHLTEGVRMSGSQVRGQLNPKSKQSSEILANDMAAEYLNNLPESDPRRPQTPIVPEYNVVSGLGVDGMTQETNTLLKNGTKNTQEFVDELSNLEPVKAWDTLMKQNGLTLEEHGQDVEVLHSKLIALITELKKTKAEISDADVTEAISTLRTDPELSPVVKNSVARSENMITAARLTGVSSENAKNMQDVVRSGEVSVPGLKKPEKFTIAKSGSAQGGESDSNRVKGIGYYDIEEEKRLEAEGAKLGNAAIKGARSAKGTAAGSPSKKAISAGKEVAEGLKIGMQEGQGGVISQAEKLGSSAVPTAAETQAKMEKMDLANKAFYDDLNTPELMDERQSLKSQDRNRRKRGATRTVDAALIGQNVVEQQSAAGASISANSQLTQEQGKANQVMLEAAKAEQFAAELRIKAAKWAELAAREGGKNMYTATNAQELEKLAEQAEAKAAELRVQAVKEQQAAVKSAKAQAKEAGKSRSKQKDVTDATEDLASATKETARAQRKSKAHAEKAANATKQTANASTQVLEAERGSAQASRQATQAKQDQAQSAVTAASLEDAVVQNLQDSVDDGNSINNAEQDSVKSAEEIAKLNNDIEAQKRKLKEEGMRAVALQQQQNATIPDGSQTAQNFVNPATALGYEDAYNEAAEYTKDKNGQLLFDPETGEPTTLSKKQLTKKKRGMRREKVGKYSGKASGVLGTATMVAGMAGAPPQVTAALGTASTVAQFAPMLAGMGPVGWAAAGIMAVGAGAYMLNKHFNKMAQEAAKFAISTSATRESMKKMGEITGKVGASEIMDRRRGTSKYNKYSDSIKMDKTFGQKFIKSDVGKDTKKVFQENVKKMGIEQATSDLSLKLAAQIADGVLSKDQAESIAQALALSMKDQKIEMQVTGKLRNLIGPDGEDLKNKPLKTRMLLVATARQRSEKQLKTIDEKKAKGESVRKDIAMLAAYNVNNLELASMMADQVENEFDIQKKKLETEIASTANAQKKLDLEKQLAGLVEKNNANQKRTSQEILMNIAQAEIDFQKVFSDTGIGGGAMREDAYFDASRSTVESAYKGTSEEAAAKKFLDKTKGLQDGAERGIYNDATDTYQKNGLGTERAAQTFQAKMELMVGSKVISPTEANAWMKMFSGRLNELDLAINTSIKQNGVGKTKELFAMFSGFTKKKVATQMIQEILLTKKDPAAFDAIMEALANLRSLDGTAIDMEVLVSAIGLEGVETLKKEFEAIEEEKDKLKKGNKKFDLKEESKKGRSSDAAVAELEKDAVQREKFNKLNVDQQADYLQKLSAAYAYQTQVDEATLALEAEQHAKTLLWQEGIKQEDANYAKKLQEYITKYLSKSVGERAVDSLDYLLDPTIASKTANANGPGSGNGTRDTTYDDIMKRLRNVRLAALNAAGGFKELEKAVAKSGSKAIGDKFKGLEQQLIQMGKTGQFTEYLAGLDQEELNKFGKAATKKGIDPNTGKKNKNVKVGDFILSDKGKKMEQGFNKAIIGDYNKEQVIGLTLAKQEIAARTKLLALGFKEVDIRTMLADENYKTLIATGKVTDAELKTNAALTEQKRLRDQINGTVAGLRDKDEIAKTQKRIPEVVAMMQKAGVNAEGIREAISDPDTLNTLIDGMDKFATMGTDAKAKFQEILDLIDETPDRKIIELVFTRTESEKRIAAADAASEMFDAYKMIDENTLKNEKGNTYAGLQVQMDDLNNQAKIAQNAINITQSEIDTMQQQVDKDQRDIETNFTRPIEQKQRAIDKLNRTAEMNFVRPIQALQDRSNILSHDLEVMNHAAEQINEKYDKQQEALSRVAEVNQQIIQQQQQQLGLADAITQGDIAAAARAAQEMRATSASNYAGNAEKALQQARQNEIDALRGGVSGKSQKDIQEEQYQLGQQIYGLEQGKAKSDADILKIQDEIYNLEQARLEAQDKIQVSIDKIAKIQFGTLLTQQNDLKAINDKILPLQQQSDILFKMIADADATRKIQGQTRAEWDAIKKAALATEALAKGDLAKALGTVGDISKAAATAWKDIKDAYDGIKDKSITITQYVKTITEPKTEDPGDKKETDSALAAEALRKLQSGQTLTDAERAALGLGPNTNSGGADSSNAPGSNNSNSTSGGSSSSSGGSGSSSGGSGSSNSSSVASATPTVYSSADAAKAANDAALADRKYGGVTAQTAAANASGNKIANAIDAAIAAGTAKTTAGITAQAKAASSVADAKLAKNNAISNAIDAALKTASTKAAPAAAALVAKKAEEVKKATALTAKFGGNSIAASQFGNWSSGGLIPKHFASGGFAMGTDTVPAMLTPGEFVMSRYAVNNTGLDNMKAINNGASLGNSVYNYSLSVNVKSDANPDDIARTVMTQIRQIDSQRIRGNRF